MTASSVHIAHWQSVTDIVGRARTLIAIMRAGVLTNHTCLCIQRIPCQIPAAARQATRAHESMTA